MPGINGLYQQVCKRIQPNISINVVLDAGLPNTFNYFFSHFERWDFIDNVSVLKDSLQIICKDQV